MSQGIGPELPATAGAKVDNCLASFFEPQCGQGVPFQLLERTNNSNWRSQS